MMRLWLISILGLCESVVEFKSARQADLMQCEVKSRLAEVSQIYLHVRQRFKSTVNVAKNFMSIQHPFEFIFPSKGALNGAKPLWSASIRI